MAVMAAVLPLLAGCDSPQTRPGSAGGRETKVGYVVVQQTSVPLTIELGGRTSAYSSSDVRPQVTGIIRRRLFTEGSEVKQGKPLYQIDPSLYQAAVAQAKANLAGARANAEATRAKADRFRDLQDSGVVSKQDYADIFAQANLAAATVLQAEAALQTAEINLKFTTVPAPISGRIGRSLFTEGALVTANQSDPLADIQQLDPIAVDIQQSSADVLELRRALSQDGVTKASTDVRLRLPDGSEYAQSGTLEFSETTVDERTGTIALRVRFANPQGLLLPGMFVRAVFAQMVDTQAILVPQAGVRLDPKGNATVLIVGDDNKVVKRDVTATRVVGTDWVVTAGLKPGDKVITEGLGKVQPGASVTPVKVGTPQIPAAAKGDVDAAAGASGG
ncbi:MAG: efflux RND transporter periplasmic adaptor subunit [Gammaproteobacteria bacterium]